MSNKHLGSDFEDESVECLLEYIAKLEAALRECPVGMYANLGSWNGGEHANRCHPSDMENVDLGLPPNKVLRKIGGKEMRKWRDKHKELLESIKETK